MTDATAETVLGEPGIVLIDFWAAWCGPCRTFAPIFEAAARRHPDITFAKVDVDSNRNLSGMFSIRSIPTMMAFRDAIPVFAQPGIMPGEAIDDIIRQIRALDMDDVRRQVAERQAPTR
ncbi:MAG: thioredoxin family protein [Myxococcales bacterium]|nr:thioredoxin family protein [Myxococcales bacterium]